MRGKLDKILTHRIFGYVIFALILVIEHTLGIQPEQILNLLNPYTIFGFLLGGAVIYWFSGASIQAVTTGASQAVAYIKDNINLDPNAPKKADVEKLLERLEEDDDVQNVYHSMEE